MKHLFQAWEEVEPRMRTARLLFLLLDYDGTRSDEEAFRAVQGQGISIFAGPEPGSSPPSFFLRDPSEVLDFLRRCEEILRN